MMRMDADGRAFFVDRIGDTFRWRSENVSTNEVADVVGQFAQVAEVNVYGVSVPRSDGRCGCAAIVMADGVTMEQFDFAGLARHCLDSLPRYAVPLFLRMTPQLEYTGTLKIQKSRLRQEGIDVDKWTSEDKMFWLPMNSSTYVPFGNEAYQALQEGNERL